MIERARQLRKVIESLATGMDDTNALQNTELFPNWGASSYEAGDRVRYNGILYKCLQSHEAQDTWNPVDAPSLWARVLIPDSEVIPDWIQPDSTNPYMKGDKVKYNDKMWISTVDNNVWAPGVYGWEEVTE